MFAVNEYILYGSVGICRIMDIRTEEFQGFEKKEYYVLKPENLENSTIFVPADNASLIKKMRRILTAAEVSSLIDTMRVDNDLWIENDRLREEKYSAIVDGGDRKEIAKLIRTLHFHRIKQSESGRKPHAADERILERAKKILYSEFALVLGITPEAVVPYILERIDPAGASGLTAVKQN